MNAHLQLATWAFILSLAITYAWWVRFRVWILREDLFEIREDLWHAMRNSGRLDDAAYRETRSSINALIRMAPWLSLAMMFRILSGGVKVERPRTDLPPEVIQ